MQPAVAPVADGPIMSGSTVLPTDLGLQWFLTDVCHNVETDQFLVSWLADVSLTGDFYLLSRHD